MSEELSFIHKLVDKYGGEEEFLQWAKDKGIRPTYNDALYWLIEVKGMCGEITL